MFSKCSKKKKTCTKNTDIQTFNFHSTFGNLKKRHTTLGGHEKKKRKAQRKKNGTESTDIQIFYFHSIFSEIKKNTSLKTLIITSIQIHFFSFSLLLKSFNQ